MSRSVREAMMPEPLAVEAQLSITETAHLMRTWAVREVLVVDDSDLVGLLTDRDVVVIAIAAGRHPDSITAGECCDRHMKTVRADDTVQHAAELMSRHGLQRLPVVDDERLVGTVWATDLEALVHH